jgi:hypothetical protein
MAYSIERLRQAIDIFNGGASQFFALLLNPYNLRERGAKRPEMLASWHDDSGDEDYDPAKGQVQKRPRGPVYQSGNTSPRMMRKTRSLSLSLQANMNMDSGLEAEGDDPIDPDNFHSEPEPEPDVWEKRWAVDTSTSPNTRYQLRPRS